MNNVEVSLLIKNWRENKDEESIAALYKQYQGFLIYLLDSKYSYMTSGVDIELLADEIFLKSIDEYNESCKINFKSYLTNRIRFALLDANKIKIRHRQESLHGEELNVPIIHCSETIQELLEILDEREQKVIKWYYLDNFDMYEIGQKLGVTQQAASLVKGKALKKLKDELATV